MDGLIFDFDGVVVDSEPIHLACFDGVLREKLGLRLPRDQYYSRFLGYDDRDCFAMILRDLGRESRDRVEQLIQAKTRRVQEAFQDHLAPMAGAIELIRAAAAEHVPLAICSGSYAVEINLALDRLGVKQLFNAMVTAEDVARGKPDPEGYLLVLKQLGNGRGKPIEARRSWVIEDSPAGIAAAKAAGLRVLAVTNSYDAPVLCAADRVVESLAAVRLRDFC